MTAPAKTLAFFGATGECAGHCLANSLKANYKCTALARTPSKLTASMKAKGVPENLLDSNLTIIQGDTRDIDAVKRTLQRADGQGIADVSISGIGSYPKFNWSITKPFVAIDPTLCYDAGVTVVRAVQELKAETKPLIVNVSTTGIPPEGKKWDVPWWFSWAYRVLLHDAHTDKRQLQDHLAEHMRLPESQRAIRGYINTKASLLLDGEAKGLESVREGSEDAPEIGYFIRRADVGLWMFERLIKSEPKAEYVNKGVVITY